MSDVFISYSRQDKEFVARLQGALAEQQREAWLDTKDIPPTAEWLKEIYGAIEKADSFVFVISPEVLGSEVCQLELAYAVKHHKRLIPVVRRDVDAKEVPDILARLNWIFCREGDDFSQAFEALLTAMATDLDHVRAHTGLLLKALEWEGRDREKSLLLRGGELKRGEEWLATSRDREPEPTPLQVQFLLASRKAATVRHRLTLSSVSFALGVTLALTVATYFLYREAGSQKESALARGLAAQSELLRSQQPHLINRSVLLALESLRRRVTLEGSLALRRGLALLPKPLATMQSGKKFRRVSISPDGKWVAGWTKSPDDECPGKVWLWEAQTGRLITSLSVEKIGYLLVVFSPDSQHLITLNYGGILTDEGISTDTGILRVIAVTDGREVSRSTLPLQKPQKAILSPDGNLIAAARPSGGYVTIYDIKKNRELPRLPFTDDFMNLIFTPNSSILALSCHSNNSNHGIMQLWQVPAGVSLAYIKYPVDHLMMSLAVSPDGQYLAAGTGQALPTEETEVVVFHLPSGEVAARLQRKGICNLGFSQNGLLMTATDDGVSVWRLRDRQEVFRVKPPSKEFDAALSPNGRWLAVKMEDVVQVYDLTTGKEAKRLPHAKISGTFFSPDSRWLYTQGPDRVIRWQIDGFKEMIQLPHHQHWSNSVEFGFSPDGKLLATGDPEENLVKVWETGTGRLLYNLDRFAIRDGGSRKKLVHGYSEAGCFSSDSQWLAVSLSYMVEVAKSKIMVGVYNMATGKLVSRVADLDSGTIVSFRPDSLALITKSGGNLKVWDLASGKLLETIPGPALPPHLKEGVKVFSPDGKWFCGLGEDNIRRVWEAATGREVFQLGPGKKLDMIAFNNTGQYLAAAVTADKKKSTLQVWVVASGRQVASVAKPLEYTKPAFDPSGKLLAVATRDNLVHLVDLATGRELARLKHENEVNYMNFSNDGHWLATGSKDNTARVWELPNGREVARLDHPNEVNMVGFSPDGSRLATSCGDFQVRLWSWRTADLVAAACRRLPRNLTKEEWREYLGDEPYRPTCPNLPAPEK